MMVRCRQHSFDSCGKRQGAIDCESPDMFWRFYRAGLSNSLPILWSLPCYRLSPSAKVLLFLQSCSLSLVFFPHFLLCRSQRSHIGLYISVLAPLGSVCMLPHLGHGMGAAKHIAINSTLGASNCSPHSLHLKVIVPNIMDLVVGYRYGLLFSQAKVHGIVARGKHWLRIMRKKGLSRKIVRFTGIFFILTTRGRSVYG